MPAIPAPTTITDPLLALFADPIFSPQKRQTPRRLPAVIDARRTKLPAEHWHGYRIETLEESGNNEGDVGSETLADSKNDRARLDSSSRIRIPGRMPQCSEILKIAIMHANRQPVKEI
jgi:hypothetical protein